LPSIWIITHTFQRLPLPLYYPSSEKKRKEKKRKGPEEGRGGEG
jgi:hypothetical protein